MKRNANQKTKDEDATWISWLVATMSCRWFSFSTAWLTLKVILPTTVKLFSEAKSRSIQINLMKTLKRGLRKCSVVSGEEESLDIGEACRIAVDTMPFFSRCLWVNARQVSDSLIAVYVRLFPKRSLFVWSEISRVLINVKRASFLHLHRHENLCH